MTREELFEKIKKLLELASSPNENEARLAMKKAQDIMANYAITEEEIRINPAELVPIRWEYKPPFLASRGLNITLAGIAMPIAKLFGGYVATDIFSSVWIYSFPTNEKVIRYTLDSILHQARIDYQKGFRKSRSITFDESFWGSFFTQLNARFAPLQKHAEGIVKYDTVREMFNRSIAGTATRNIGTYSSLGVAAGASAAQSVQIRPGVEVNVKGNLLG